MAFKLTKAEEATRDEHVKKLSEAASEVENTIITYNSALEDAKNFIDEVKDRLQSEFDDKGDNWQEKSTKSEGVQSMIGEWESVDMEELDIPSMDHSEAIENLPVDAE